MQCEGSVTQLSIIRAYTAHNMSGIRIGYCGLETGLLKLGIGVSLCRLCAHNLRRSLLQG